MSILSGFNITAEEYQTRKPFPHMYMDNFLNEKFAKTVQEEIMGLSGDMFDRYNNPFEDKYTLRDKYNYPPTLNKLMETLETDEFVDKLSNLVGHKLIRDPNRNFWGVHKYEPGDKLDIHVDAGLHPISKEKKQVTLGIYLSYNWKEDNGCWLEVWRGDNAKDNDAKLYEQVAKIAPMFNRLIIFTCDDYSWHGNPEPVVSQDPSSRRIFVTLSYLSHDYEDENKRQKAYFVARPQDKPDEEKDKLRLLRADPEKYKEIYRYKKNE